MSAPGVRRGIEKENTIPDPRINGAIRASSVRVVDPDGAQLGVLDRAEALRLASEAGLDLVEVAPLADPPVCRIMDYGAFHFEQVKKEREAKRKSKGPALKEVKLSLKIGAADIETKARLAIGFLDAGARVRVSLQFRGREIAHSDLGRDIMLRFIERLSEHGSPERPPSMEGKIMSALLSSAKPAKPAV
jgi:translation initiation factor IF-3